MKITIKDFEYLGETIKIASNSDFTDPFSRWLRRDWQPEDHSIITSQLLGENDLFLDLGANYGTFSIPVVMQSKARCIAVEALRQNVPVLHAAIEANGLGDKIEWVLAAISGSAGEVRISGESAYGTVSEEGQRVLSYGLDDLIDEFDLTNLKLVKMDIEGLEMEALAESRTFFDKFPNVSFVFEANAAHCYRTNCLPQDLVGFFEEKGYNLYLSKYGRIVKRTSKDFQESGVSDYIAVKGDVMKNVKGFNFDDFNNEHKINETLSALTKMKSDYKDSSIQQWHLAPEFIKNNPEILETGLFS